MKLRKILAASLLGLLLNNPAEAQRLNACVTDTHNQELKQKHPAVAASQAAMEQQIQQYISRQGNKRLNGTVIKIPVVVHVVTTSGCDGISKAQILNGLEVLNQDFRRQNADTANTRAIFKPYAADTEIEFVLACKDPGGGATEGIVRVTSTTANAPYNRDDVKTAAPAWPTDKYLNIWLVESIWDSGVGANVAGYAQFPHIPPSGTFGVVLVHTQWGKQGAVPGSTANSTGHYATHEIAHCFHLQHIESMNCNDADLVADTPPSTFASPTTLTCNFTQNTCSNDVALGFPMDMPDQIENYMSVSDFSCTNMFTRGQKNRMHASLNTYPHLQNLSSVSNASVTGIDQSTANWPTAPMPYFCVDNQSICEGGSVTFTDKSYNSAATSWYWTFQGGTPATSSLQNPVVTYNTSGKYNVTLSVANQYGLRTTTWTEYITVRPATNLINVSPPNYYVESFEESTFPESTTANRNWEKATSSLAPNPQNWSRVSTAFSGISYSGGSNSLRLQNASLPAGTVSTLITPNFTAQGGYPSRVFFEMAYAKRTAQPAEVLKMFYSNDCGATWNGPIKTLSGNQLVTNGGAQVGNFVPVASEWRMEGISQNASTFFQNNQHVMFKIEVTSNGGGNLYIDNFTIGSVLGTNEQIAGLHKIKLFPNPLTTETGIAFELKTTEKVAVKVLDVIGNTVYEQPGSTFKAGSHTISIAGKLKNAKAGMYLVQMNLSGKVYNTKLLVQ